MRRKSSIFKRSAALALTGALALSLPFTAAAVETEGPEGLISGGFGVFSEVTPEGGLLISGAQPEGEVPDFSQDFSSETLLVQGSITFDPNGGTGTMEALAFSGAEVLRLPENTFTNGGLLFLGWNTDAGGGGLFYTDGQEILTGASLTLYAQWGEAGPGLPEGGLPVIDESSDFSSDPLRVECTIRFDPNGGSGEMEELRAWSGSTVRLTENRYTHGAQRFLGWNTEADGSGLAYRDGEEVLAGASMTLYAQWGSRQSGGSSSSSSSSSSSAASRAPVETQPQETEPAPSEETEPEPEAAPALTDYNDLRENEWYSGGVQYVLQKGWMSGVGEGSFAPDVTMSRAMLVTVLYRAAGQPETAGTTGFTDLEDGSWYADAVRWAAANGIAAGYSADRFGPGGAITREQLAVMLWRWAQKQGRITEAEPASLDAYTDGAEISPWAAEALAWAVGAGILQGTGDGQLSPQAPATRAQTAVMLQRYGAGEAG